MGEQGKSGEASRFEAESHHGWSPDIGAGGETTAAEAGSKARQELPPETGEGREISEAERKGVASTDMEPGSPFGAGDSRTRRGEETAAAQGREAEGHKGVSQRPYGSHGEEEASGVAPQGPRDPESPNMPPGDQGG
jgi:hypothetical protein